MANTERLKTLELVRAAKQEVGAALSQVKTASEAKPLEELQLNLEKLEGDLIASALDDKIGKLKEYKKRLEAANADIRGKAKDLTALAEKVETAAKAMGLLIDIVGKAAVLAGL